MLYDKEVVFNVFNSMFLCTQRANRKRFHLVMKMMIWKAICVCVIVFNFSVNLVAELNIQTCVNGWITAQEGKETVIKCSGQSSNETVYWRVETITTNQILFEGSCNDSQENCTFSSNDQITLTMDKDFQSSLVIKRTNVSSHGGANVTCSDSKTHQHCRINVIHAPTLSQCKIEVNKGNGTVAGSCNIKKFFSYNNLFSCSALQRMGTTATHDKSLPGLISLQDYTDSQDNKTYKQGNCSFRTDLPTEKGNYTYNIVVPPDQFGVTAGKIEIENRCTNVLDGNPKCSWECVNRQVDIPSYVCNPSEKLPVSNVTISPSAGFNSSSSDQPGSSSSTPFSSSQPVPLSPVTFDSSATHVSSSPSTNVSSPPSTNVSSPASTNVSSPASTNVSSPASTNVSSPASTNVSSPASTNVSSPASTNVSPPASTNMSSPASTNVSSPASTNVSSPASTNVSPPASTNVSSPASTNMSSPASTNVSSPASTNVSSSPSTSVSSSPSTHVSSSLSTRVSLPSSSHVSSSPSTNVISPVSTNVSSSPSTNVSSPVSTNVSSSPSTNVSSSPSTNVSSSPSTNVSSSASTKVSSSLSTHVSSSPSTHVSSFSVTHLASSSLVPLGSPTSDPNKNRQPAVAIIVAGVIAALVFIIIVIIIIYIVKGKRNQSWTLPTFFESLRGDNVTGQSNNHQLQLAIPVAQNESSGENTANDEFEDQVNTVYVSADVFALEEQGSLRVLPVT